MVGIGPLCDFHNCLIARLSATQLLARYDNVVGVEGARGDEHGQFFVNTQGAHKGIAGVLQNFNHLCLFNVVAAARHDRHAHTVAIEGIHRVALGYKQRCAAIVGSKGVFAVCLAYEGALLQLSLGVEAVLVVRHTCEIIVPRHLLHDIDGQHLQGVCVEVQRAENLFKREGALGIVGKKLDQPFRQFLFGEALASFLSFSHNENILCGVHVGVWGARVVNIGK